MKDKLKYIFLTIFILLFLYFYKSTSSSFDKVYVTKVIDGDTIRATSSYDSNFKVRLIGINAPEKGKEKYWKESKSYAQKLMENKYCYLEKDTSDKDKYGRYLRYVWLKKPKKKNFKNIEELNVSAIMLKKGLARTYTFEPDTLYLKEFKKIEKKARKFKRGFWIYKKPVTRGNKRWNMYKYNMEELFEMSVKKLEEIGVSLDDIAEIVLMLQKEYLPSLTHEYALENLKMVLHKREVIHAVLTGLAIDKMATEKLLPEPIQSIISVDEGLYGIDEVLPLGIVNCYGSIGFTNFGYLDKKKIGIIKYLDEMKSKDIVTTFADDIVAALAAATASRIAHKNIYDGK